MAHLNSQKPQGPFRFAQSGEQMAVANGQPSRVGELFLQQQLVVPCENKPVNLTVMFNQNLLLSPKQRRGSNWLLVQAISGGFGFPGVLIGHGADNAEKLRD